MSHQQQHQQQHKITIIKTGEKIHDDEFLCKKYTVITNRKTSTMEMCFDFRNERDDEVTEHIGRCLKDITDNYSIFKD